MRNIANIVNIAILAICIAAPAMAQTSVIQPSGPSPAKETRTFALQSDGNIKVANVNGHIKLTAWDKDEVSLTATFEPSRRDAKEYPKIEVDSKKNYLELIVKYPQKRNENGRCDMELFVPRRINSKIATVNGLISLNGIEGEHNLSTVNGGADFDQVGGTINVTSVNGGISGSVQQIRDSLSASTVNGSINIALSDPNCALRASNVNGGVVLKTPGAKDFSANKNSVRATFGNGDAKINLSTVNGSIVVQ